MRKISLMLMILFFAATFAYAKGYEVSKTAGPFSLTVMMDHNPPITGENALTIAIKDNTGKVLTDAKVQVDYGMPAMPGMPAMHYKLAPTLKGKVYAGKINFSMPGAWNITVKVERPGASGSAKLNIDVQ